MYVHKHITLLNTKEMTVAGWVNRLVIIPCPSSVDTIYFVEYLPTTKFAKCEPLVIPKRRSREESGVACGGSAASKQQIPPFGRNDNAAVA
jgi:hypothetical protein